MGDAPTPSPAIATWRPDSDCLDPLAEALGELRARLQHPFDVEAFDRINAEAGDLLDHATSDRQALLDRMRQQSEDAEVLGPAPPEPYQLEALYRKYDVPFVVEWLRSKISPSCGEGVCAALYRLLDRFRTLHGRAREFVNRQQGRRPQLRVSCAIKRAQYLHYRLVQEFAAEANAEHPPEPHELPAPLRWSNRHVVESLCEWTTLCADAEEHLRRVATLVRQRIIAQSGPAVAPAAAEHVAAARGGQGDSFGKAELRALKLAKAMLLVRDHPDWSNAVIARQVGWHPSSLSRSPEFEAAAALARGARDEVRKGYITSDADSGLRDVEAPAPLSGQPGSRADRGQPVAGSGLVREYCDDCGEPMRVAPDKVGTKPRCKDCQT